MGCQQSAPKMNRKASVSSQGSERSAASTSSSASKTSSAVDPRSAALSMRSGGFFGPSYCANSSHMRDSGMYAIGFGVAY